MISIGKKKANRFAVTGQKLFKQYQILVLILTGFRTFREKSTMPSKKSSAM